MKKEFYRIIPLGLIFILLVIINIYASYREVITDETVTKMIEEEVFQRAKKDEAIFKRPLNYSNFYLLFDEQKLTTKNFISLFSFFNKYELQIKKIYPYFNPMYEEYLSYHVGEVIFLNDDITAGLNTLVEKYLTILNDYGLDEEIDKVNLNGISIRVVLINCSNQTMVKFLTKYPKIKYSYQLDGIYRRLD